MMDIAEDCRLFQAAAKSCVGAFPESAPDPVWQCGLTALQQFDHLGGLTRRKRMICDLLRARRWLSALICVGAAAVSAPPVAAQTVEQFYKGRTITLFVASAPGGINDLTARLIAKHMSAFIAGKPTIVV